MRWKSRPNIGAVAVAGLALIVPATPALCQAADSQTAQAAPQLPGGPGDVLGNVLAKGLVEPDVGQYLRWFRTRLKRDLKPGNGWLLSVEMFTDGEGHKHPGRVRPIEILAQAPTPNDAALVYYLGNELPAAPPPGMLFDEKQSYIIWAVNGPDDILFSKIAYPFSAVTLDTGSRAAELKLAADADSPAGSKAEQMLRAADANARLARAQLEIARLRRLADLTEQERRKQQAAQLDAERLRNAAEQRNAEIAAQLARDAQRVQAAQRQLH